MKNLKNNRKIAYLPKREPMYGIHKNAWLQGKRHSTYHPVDGVWPYERVNRMIESNIGKPFDVVFSKYCSEVPVYQQQYFLEKFEHNRYYYRYGNTYYIDEHGLIQKNKEEKRDKKVTYYSDDYKTIKLHKETKKPYPDWYDKALLIRQGRFNEDDYVNFVVEGYSMEFSSKNDPTYKRLMAEKEDRRRLRWRLHLKEKEEKYNDMVNKAYQRLKEEKEAELEKNKIKIESKGFDYITSFRNDKQTNPDLIKKDQGFDFFSKNVA